MALFDLGKKLAESVTQAANSVVNTMKDGKLPETVGNALNTAVDAVKNVKLTDITESAEKTVAQVKGMFTPLKLEEEKKDDDVLKVERISSLNAVKVIWFLMAADGQIYQNEEEKFNSVGRELCATFDEKREELVADCQKCPDQADDPDEYLDVLQDGVLRALLTSKVTEDTFITPKLLLWNMLVLAYSDGEYGEAERKLIRFTARKLDIDKSVLLEMDNSIQTITEIDNEMKWIKTTDRPYLTIEAMVNELNDRKTVVFDSVKELIAL